MLILTLAVPICAQQNKAASQKKTTTATQKKSTSSKTKSSTQKKKKTSQKVTNADIKKLENKRSQVQTKIKQEEKKLNANKADVKKRLDNLMLINGEIDKQQKDIARIEKDIADLNSRIATLEAQLSTLEAQLKERKEKYIKSLRYMARHRNIQEDLMFIFSADNLTQMYRRMRFVREYASYQRAQGEAVKTKQEQIAAKHEQLKKDKARADALLAECQAARNELQSKQSEQQRQVKSLQRQQKTIQGIIAEQRKQDAALNAEIDRLVAEEIERARQREEAKAKRKAEQEAERRKAELARKKAEAELAARENERRIAEAKEREAQAKAAAKEAATKSDAERRQAEQAAKSAKAERVAAEKKAKIDAERNKKEVAKAAEAAKTSSFTSSTDRKLTGNFESNRGKLPVPVTGQYKVVSRFGQYNVEGLKNVTLDNKGINIQCRSGAKARSIFNGEVSAVASFAGTMIVMVRHGSYISVYCNLKSVSVSKGQKVSTGQELGAIAGDNILQFQLRKETAKLNPEQWLAM